MTQVDAAVVELNIGQKTFKKFLRIPRNRMKLGQNLRVAGFRKGFQNEPIPFYTKAAVTQAPMGNDISIVYSEYYNAPSMSGSGVVTTRRGGVDHVVGLHVGSNDTTRRCPRWNLTPQSTHEDIGHFVNGVIDHLSDAIHGHASYTLICDIAKVPGLLNFLEEKGVLVD